MRTDMQHLAKVYSTDGIDVLVQEFRGLYPSTDGLKQPMLELFDLVNTFHHAFQALLSCNEEHGRDDLDEIISREGAYYTFVHKTSPEIWFRARHPVYRAWTTAIIAHAELQDFCYEHF